MTVRLLKLLSAWRQPLNKLLPPSATEAKKLQKQLMHAGYRSAEAPIIYRALQLARWPVFRCGCRRMCFDCATAEQALIFIIGAFVAGFFLPRYFLGRMIKKRQSDFRWGLADALDLMVVSVEAGLGLNAAMMKVSTELRDVHPPSQTNLNSPTSKSEWDANVTKHCAILQSAPVSTICTASWRC
jgi:tight adherence protein C